MDFNEIIEKAFDEKVKILRDIKSGLRCKTYLVEVRGRKYIFQIYTGNTIYQAKKKYNILNKINSRFIPKTIKVEENEDYSYLITQYFEGQTLQYYRNIDSKFSLRDISKELANALGQVHKISDINKFGWIDNKCVKVQNNLIDYIQSEYNRISVSFDNIDTEIKKSILNKVKKAIEIIDDKSKNIAKSCLCWYDMNPGNILIGKKEKRYQLEALIDPGGARYGVPEWDIAFIKMQVCRCKEEFDDFLEKYKQMNSEISIDMELVNALSVIVEMDVISIEIAENSVILPVPYDTNFKNEIKTIHRGLIS